MQVGDEVTATSDLTGVTAVTANLYAQPGSESGVWERVPNGWRGRISGVTQPLSELIKGRTVWVLEVQAALTLPEPPENTVALIGRETGARYTRYRRTASWQDSGGNIFSLGSLLDFERELTPELAPSLAKHLERVCASIHSGAPAEVWESLDAIKAAILKDGAA